MHNLERLIDDIYSLDIQSLPSVEMKFKRVVEMYLGSEQVTNPEIKNLFKRNEVLSSDELKSIFVTMTPMYPSLAHGKYRHSNAGIYQGLINKFTNIPSLSEQIQDYMEVDFLTLIKDNNLKIIRIIKERLDLPENWLNKKYFKSNCTTELATLLRIEHYGQELIGVTKPHPLHQTWFANVDSVLPEHIDKSLLITSSAKYRTISNASFLKHGPFNMYYGSATKEKVKTSIELYTTTNFLKSLQQLIMLLSWTQRLGCGNIQRLIADLIKEKYITVSDQYEDYDLLDWSAINLGGNMIHRFRSIMEKRSALLNHQPTVGTHIKQSTNRLVSISRNGENYTIHLQMLLISNI